MNEFKRTTIHLSVKYSLIFFVFIWLFSAGIYVWVDNSLGEGYVNRITNTLERQHSSANRQAEVSDNAASVASDIALDRLRNILLVINIGALFAVPLTAYFISKRTLMPLIKNQKSQQRFIANASHELRTPLAVMLADLDWATKKKRSAAEYHRTLTSTKAEVQHMSTLVTSLLTLARLSDNKSYTREEVAVDELIREVLTHYEPTARSHSLTFNIDLQAQLISGNRMLLEVVVRNLIDNAVKYALPNTTIDITATTSKGVTTILIRNMTAELNSGQLVYLFDRFYQGGVHHADEGFGLGLAIVRQLLDVSEGTIDAKYTEKDRKLEMRITLR